MEICHEGFFWSVSRGCNGQLLGACVIAWGPALNYNSLHSDLTPIIVFWSVCVCVGARARAYNDVRVGGEFTSLPQEFYFDSWT